MKPPSRSSSTSPASLSNPRWRDTPDCAIPRIPGQLRHVQPLGVEQPQDPQPGVVAEQPEEGGAALHIYKSTLIDILLQIGRLETVQISAEGLDYRHDNTGHIESLDGTYHLPGGKTCRRPDPRARRRRGTEEPVDGEGGEGDRGAGNHLCDVRLPVHHRRSQSAGSRAGARSALARRPRRGKGASPKRCRCSSEASRWAAGSLHTLPRRVSTA